MQTRILSAVLLAFSTAAFAGGAFTLQFDNPSEDGGFTQNQLLSAPYGFGCSGGNAPPALSWKNPPAGTKSFVLTVYDKDAPTGLGWMHWVVADIPADVRRRNAASLQLSRCANIADRTGLDALGGRRHSRRCPPPQRGLAAIKPLHQHRRRPVRSHIGGNQFADLPHQVDAFVHGKTDAVMLQPRQHAAKRGLRSIVRHFFIRQYRSLIIKRRAHTPGIRQLYRIAHCLRRPVLCGEPFYGFLFESNPLRLIETV
ncbi:hypothetical protein NMEN93003_1467 [Neisseria meningitidis 93003]|nr:hypothetical protein NMEN93003_1467 [Neisseria meningitidis 93003]